MNELDRQALALDVIEEMNAKHAAVMVGGQFAVLNLADDDSRFTCSKRADFFNRYADEMVPQLMQSGQTKPPTKAHIWWESALRRKYTGITFAPGKPQDVDGKFNTWRGFAITPKQGDSTLYWQFVRDAICNGDEVVLAYVRRYLAHLVQKPNELPGVALVLRSGQTDAVIGTSMVSHGVDIDRLNVMLFNGMPKRMSPALGKHGLPSVRDAATATATINCTSCSFTNAGKLFLAFPLVSAPPATK